MPPPRHVLTILAVRDLRLASRFYDRAFGWTKSVNETVYVEYELPGGQRVGLYDRVAFGRNTGRVPAAITEGELAPAELYLHVDQPEAAMRSLADAGARLLSGLEPRAWGDEAAYFADPDGNVIVVARELSSVRAAGASSAKREPPVEWDPDRYLRFEAERAAPFEETCQLVRPRAGMRVADLGCGAGDLTSRLAARLPDSEVLGLDSSPAMIERASRLAGPRLRFERRDLQTLEGRWDLVFAHASLQWVDDHPALLARLRDHLAPGGQLAAQIPANHGHFTHTALAELAGQPPFGEALASWVRVPPVLRPSEYAELLFRLGFESISVRLVVYPHVLKDADAVVEWMRGTGMLPYLERLPESLREPFIDGYREVLRARWPEKPVFFGFDRILLAGTRPVV